MVLVYRQTVFCIQVSHKSPAGHQDKILFSRRRHVARNVIMKYFQYHKDFTASYFSSMKVRPTRSYMKGLINFWPRCWFLKAEDFIHLLVTMSTPAWLARRPPGGPGFWWQVREECEHCTVGWYGGQVVISSNLLGLTFEKNWDMGNRVPRNQMVNQWQVVVGIKPGKSY